VWSQLVISPLLELQQRLGQRAFDATLSAPPTAPGDSAVALRRTTLLLSALACYPACRDGILAADETLLSAAVLPGLRQPAQGGEADSALQSAALRQARALGPARRRAALCIAPAADEAHPHHLPYISPISPPYLPHISQVPGRR